MHSGEQESSVNDRPDQPALVERLYAERDSNGSTLNYVNDLIIYYTSLDEHQANMLQLQRQARMIVDPSGVERGIGYETDAFYWGEVLGYSACETMFDEAWKEISWKILHRVQTIHYDEAWTDLDGSHESRMEAIGLEIQGNLELLGNGFPESFQAMISKMASELHPDPTVQEYVVLGFKHVMNAALDFQPKPPAADTTTDINNAANDLLYRNGYLPLEQEPKFVGAEFTRQAMLDMFYETCLELDIHEQPDDEEQYLAQLQTLSSAINTKFMEHPGVHLGDEYRFSGSVLAVVYSLEHPEEVKSFMIDDGAVVEGAMQPVYVLEGPSETIIDILQHNPDPDPEDFEKHVNPYCPMLEIGHAIIQEPDGTLHQVPKHEQLFIVLNNEQMHLERFVVK